MTDPETSFATKIASELFATAHDEANRAAVAAVPADELDLGKSRRTRGAMRTTITLAAAVAALAVPVAGIGASLQTKPKPKPKKTVVITTKTFKGDVEPAGDFGQVRVVIIARKTSTIVRTTNAPTTTTATKHIVQMSVPVSPYQAARSLYISEESIPVLEKEAFTAIKANSTRIDLVSGATYTSQAFEQSLQSAILQERAW